MPDRREFWEQRGISEEVKKARRYVHWVDGDATDVSEGYKRAGIKGGSLGTLTRWARQEQTKEEKPDGTEVLVPGSGVLITRHAPPGYPIIPPEMRPKYPIKTETTRHYHGSRPYDPEDYYGVRSEE